MKKISLRQKDFMRKGYVMNYNDLLWFLCYGVGGVCFVKYISLIFGYTDNQCQSIFEELESIGFIEYIYYKGFKIVKVKSATYDYMELTEDEIAIGKRLFKRVNDKEENILRSAMICKFYLRFVKVHKISKIIKKVKNKSNLYFLNKNASKNLLLTHKEYAKENLKNEIDKHIKVIDTRFNRQSLGHQNLINKDISKGQVSYTSKKKNLYDELEEKGIITLSEKRGWEDFYSLSLKSIYLWGRTILRQNNISYTRISFVMIINDNFKMKKVLTNMKQAKKMIDNLFSQTKTVITFELLSVNLSNRDLDKIKNELKKDNQGFLNNINECEKLNLTFINHTLADYKNIPSLDEYLYSDNVI